MTFGELQAVVAILHTRLRNVLDTSKGLPNMPGSHLQARVEATLALGRHDKAASVYRSQLQREGLALAAERIVARLEDDISDRRGLKWEWGKIDDDVKDEIRSAWKDLISEALS